jgi:prophage regulatory protein
MTDKLRLLSKKQVRELVLYSYAHIDRLEHAGQFPKRVRLSTYRTGRVGYVESEIQDWLKSRLLLRDAS